jgi:hypothetical protein
VLEISELGAGSAGVVEARSSKMREVANPVREAEVGQPSILILILPIDDREVDVELDNIIDPVPNPKPDKPVSNGPPGGDRDSKRDLRAGESRDGSSRGLHIGDPDTARIMGVWWTRGEKIDRVISSCVAGEGRTTSSVGGVDDSVAGSFKTGSCSMVEESLGVMTAIASSTRVASDDRVVKTGIASGVGAGG